MESTPEDDRSACAIGRSGHDFGAESEQSTPRTADALEFTADREERGAMERPITGLERLRESVATRVQATSLRSVARQVGMSPSGLEKFLCGGTPYSRSRQKLQEWWVREGQRPRTDLSGEGMEVAVAALVRDVPPEQRTPAMKRLVRSLRGVYEAEIGICPPWLDDLADRWLVDRPARVHDDEDD